MAWRNCVLEHLTSLNITWPNTEGNPKGEKNKGTRATVIFVEHRFLILYELRMGPTGLVQTLGFLPGFLPSQFQVCPFTTTTTLLLAIQVCSSPYHFPS